MAGQTTSPSPYGNDDHFKDLAPSLADAEAAVARIPAAIAELSAIESGEDAKAATQARTILQELASACRESNRALVARRTIA